MREISKNLLYLSHFLSVTLCVNCTRDKLPVLPPSETLTCHLQDADAIFISAATSGARKLPPSPKKLQVRTISQHAIKVKWHDPGRLKDDGSRFYSVRYSAAGQEEKPKFVQTQEKRVRVSKLQPNTTYVFAVKAVVGKQGSPWSATAAATTGVTGEFKGRQV